MQQCLKASHSERERPKPRSAHFFAVAVHMENPSLETLSIGLHSSLLEWSLKTAWIGYHMVSPQCMHCLGHEIKTEAWVLQHSRHSLHIFHQKQLDFGQQEMVSEDTTHTRSCDKARHSSPKVYSIYTVSISPTLPLPAVRHDRFLLIWIWLGSTFHPTFQLPRHWRSFSCSTGAHLHGPAPHQRGALGAFVKVEHDTRMDSWRNELYLKPGLSLNGLWGGSCFFEPFESSKEIQNRPLTGWFHPRLAECGLTKAWTCLLDLTCTSTEKGSKMESGTAPKRLAFSILKIDAGIEHELPFGMRALPRGHVYFETQLVRTRARCEFSHLKWVSSDYPSQWLAAESTQYECSYETVNLL